MLRQGDKLAAILDLDPDSLQSCAMSIQLVAAEAAAAAGGTGAGAGETVGRIEAICTSLTTVDWCIHSRADLHGRYVVGASLKGEGCVRLRGGGWLGVSPCLELVAAAAAAAAAEAEAVAEALFLPLLPMFPLKAQAQAQGEKSLSHTHTTASTRRRREEGTEAMIGPVLAWIEGIVMGGGTPAAAGLGRRGSPGNG